MNAHAKPTNPLHNYTPEFLADEIGAQDVVVKEATNRLNMLKDEAKRRGIESAQGIHYRIIVDSSVRISLDSAALVSLLGKESLAPYYRATPVSTLRISALFQQPEVVG